MTETYHIYGFGVELSQLGEISLGRLEQLIDMAPIFKSKIIKWFEDEKIDKPTLENYYEYDEENLGLPSLLKEVIFELEGIDLTACEDLNSRQYLLYEGTDGFDLVNASCQIVATYLKGLSTEKGLEVLVGLKYGC